MTVPGLAWPAVWQARARYLPWRAVPRRNGTVGKVPVGVHGQPVDPLDPRAWLTWEAAWARVSTGQADGAGLAITPGLRLTAIDLDACLDAAGHLTSLARDVLDVFPGAYVERSPSGKGLHLLVRGHCPAGWRRQAGLEIIDRGYLTVTGLGYGPPRRLAEADDAGLARWHAGRAPVRQATPSPRSSRPPPGDWFTRACRARNGARFQSLWEGQLAGCATASEGDLHLLLLILYWWPEASDPQLRTILLESGRDRPKLRDGRYVDRTLAAARRLQRT